VISAFQFIPFPFDSSDRSRCSAIIKPMIMEKVNQRSNVQVAEIEISYHPNIKPSQRPRVTSSKEVDQILRSTWNTDTMELLESFKVVMLNRANRVLGVFELSQGGIAGTVADPKLIFASALKAAASSIIVAHNHPSGNLSPSQEDIQLTKKLVAAGKLLDLQVVDHVIISSEGYNSMADEGLM
jgi:DNA repair protein RadC